MQFSVARPDVVRAINQRWLLKFWKRSSGSQAMPQWHAVETENLSAISPNLSFLEVVNGAGGARFVVRFNGAPIAQVYGKPVCGGGHLDKIIPPVAHAHGLAPYRHAVESRCPVYTIHDIADRNGRLVHYERLLL